MVGQGDLSNRHTVGNAVGKQQWIMGKAKTLKMHGDVFQDVKTQQVAFDEIQASENAAKAHDPFRKELPLQKWTWLRCFFYMDLNNHNRFKDEIYWLIRREIRNELLEKKIQVRANAQRAVQSVIRRGSREEIPGRPTTPIGISKTLAEELLSKQGSMDEGDVRDHEPLSDHGQGGQQGGAVGTRGSILGNNRAISAAKQALASRSYKRGSSRASGFGSVLLGGGTASPSGKSRRSGMDMSVMGGGEDITEALTDVESRSPKGATSAMAMLNNLKANLRSKKNARLAKTQATIPALDDVEKKDKEGGEDGGGDKDGGDRTRSTYHFPKTPAGAGRAMTIDLDDDGGSEMSNRLGGGLFGQGASQSLRSVAQNAITAPMLSVYSRGFWRCLAAKPRVIDTARRRSQQQSSTQSATQSAVQSTKSIGGGGGESLNWNSISKKNEIADEALQTSTGPRLHGTGGFKKKEFKLSCSDIPFKEAFILTKLPVEMRPSWLTLQRDASHIFNEIDKVEGETEEEKEVKRRFLRYSVKLPGGETQFPALGNRKSVKARRSEKGLKRGHSTIRRVVEGIEFAASDTDSSGNTTPVNESADATNGQQSNGFGKDNSQKAGFDKVNSQKDGFGKVNSQKGVTKNVSIGKNFDSEKAVGQHQSFVAKVKQRVSLATHDVTEAEEREKAEQKRAEKEKNDKKKADQLAKEKESQLYMIRVGSPPRRGPARSLLPPDGSFQLPEDGSVMVKMAPAGWDPKLLEQVMKTLLSAMEETKEDVEEELNGITKSESKDVKERTKKRATIFEEGSKTDEAIKDFLQNEKQTCLELHNASPRHTAFLRPQAKDPTRSGIDFNTERRVRLLLSDPGMSREEMLPSPQRVKYTFKDESAAAVEKANASIKKSRETVVPHASRISTAPALSALKDKYEPALRNVGEGPYDTYIAPLDEKTNLKRMVMNARRADLLRACVWLGGARELKAQLGQLGLMGVQPRRAQDQNLELLTTIDIVLKNKHVTIQMAETNPLQSPPQSPDRGRSPNRTDNRNISANTGDFLTLEREKEMREIGSRILGMKIPPKTLIRTLAAGTNRSLTHNKNIAERIPNKNQLKIENLPANGNDILANVLRAPSHATIGVNSQSPSKSMSTRPKPLQANHILDLVLRHEKTPGSVRKFKHQGRRLVRANELFLADSARLAEKGGFGDQATEMFLSEQELAEMGENTILDNSAHKDFTAAQKNMGVVVATPIIAPVVAVPQSSRPRSPFREQQQRVLESIEKDLKTLVRKEEKLANKRVELVQKLEKLYERHRLEKIKENKRLYPTPAKKKQAEPSIEVSKVEAEFETKEGDDLDATYSDVFYDEESHFEDGGSQNPPPNSDQNQTQSGNSNQAQSENQTRQDIANQAQDFMFFPESNDHPSNPSKDSSKGDSSKGNTSRQRGGSTSKERSKEAYPTPRGNNSKESSKDPHRSSSKEKDAISNTQKTIGNTTQKTRPRNEMDEQKRQETKEKIAEWRQERDAEKELQKREHNYIDLTFEDRVEQNRAQAKSSIRDIYGR